MQCKSRHIRHQQFRLPLAPTLSMSEWVQSPGHTTLVGDATPPTSSSSFHPLIVGSHISFGSNNDNDGNNDTIFISYFILFSFSQCKCPAQCPAWAQFSISWVQKLSTRAEYLIQEGWLQYLIYNGWKCYKPTNKMVTAEPPCRI